MPFRLLTQENVQDLGASSVPKEFEWRHVIAGLLGSGVNHAESRPPHTWGRPASPPIVSHPAIVAATSSELTCPSFNTTTLPRSQLDPTVT